MSVKDEIGNSLLINKSAYSWAWAIIVYMGTTIPLFLGVVRSENTLSIFGGLTGYFLGLCTETGPLNHRIKISSLCCFCLLLAFYLGLWTQQSIEIFFTMILMMTYTIGVITGKGAEVERLMILSTVGLIVSRYASHLTLAHFPQISFYLITAYLSVLFTNIVLSFFFTFKEEAHLKIRHAVSHLKTQEKSRHFYALTYAAAVCLTLLLDQLAPIERGYWMVITVLLMMRPTRRESFQRVLQRIVGSLLGIIVGLPFILIHFPIAVYVMSAAVFAATVPIVWKRNYWMVSLCVTVFVICLLEVATGGTLEASITYARLRSTIYGSAISMVMIFLFHCLKLKKED